MLKSLEIIPRFVELGKFLINMVTKFFCEGLLPTNFSALKLFWYTVEQHYTQDKCRCKNAQIEYLCF